MDCWSFGGFEDGLGGFFGGFQYGFGWIIEQFRDGFDGLKMISVDYSPFSRWFRWIVGRLGGLKMVSVDYWPLGDFGRFEDGFSELLDGLKILVDY